ncbi:hypothetical protein DESC_40100 [Desulfosarcina cetonica]|nr:hypothetical protein DESC_40100 [Desulfosarcina cetonica]
MALVAVFYGRLSRRSVSTQQL